MNKTNQEEESKEGAGASAISANGFTACFAVAAVRIPIVCLLVKVIRITGVEKNLSSRYCSKLDVVRICPQ